ncbi:hypothetical protein D3C79_907330 [compost metagenome]
MIRVLQDERFERIVTLEALNLLVQAPPIRKRHVDRSLRLPDLVRINLGVDRGNQAYRKLGGDVSSRFGCDRKFQVEVHQIALEDLSRLGPEESHRLCNV